MNTDLKMYREILKFIKNQKAVIESYKKESSGKSFCNYTQQEEFFAINNRYTYTLNENLDIFEKHINNIIDDKENNK